MVWLAVLREARSSARLTVREFVGETSPFGPGDLAPLSQRFIRCHHCGLPHNLTDEVCPITGKPIRQRRKKAQGEASAPVKREESGRAIPIPLVSQRQGSRHKAPREAGDEHRLVGRIIGAKYRVHSLIGEGGMGTVYEAEHLEIGRRVAIKVLNRAHTGRREAVARFHQEARAAGAIGHPNICEIYDVGRLDDGSPYLVMERLHGKTLADRINIEGALPFEDVIAVLTQVLSALVAAHDKGIIHRDVKPENIFLTERVGCAPVIKILDFGISKSADESGDLSLTRTGMVMGTPFYMAPEQARGEHIDHRVDIYACGVMLYEALTGRRPFIASNYNALVIQVLSAQPRDPREIRPAIPAAFVPVIYKALAKRRDDRFENATRFIKALSKVESELGRGPTNEEIKKLAEEVRQSTRPPPALVAPDISSDSMDIPVVFSETGTGQQPVDLSTGEVEVNLDTGPNDSQQEDDPTVVGDQQAFDDYEERSDRFVMSRKRDEEDVHDTIVDPSGAMLGELWAQLGRGDQESEPPSSGNADATVRTEGLDGESASRVLDSLQDPDGGATEADGEDERGRYSMISSFPKSDEEEPERRTARKPKARVPRPTGAPAPAAPVRVPKPPKRTNLGAPPPPPERRRAAPSDPNEPDDDAVTTLFVSSDDGPREANAAEGDKGPKIPRPPGTPRW